MQAKIALNPYLPGWEYVPDGEPHVFDNRLYVFGSHDKAFGTAYCEEDYTVWSAPLDNLGSWTNHGVSYRKAQDPHYQKHHSELWAPDVCRGTDGRYYLYYCCAFVPEIGIAVADVPEGPYAFYDYVRDSDGNIWDKDLPFDPGILFEDSEHIWLYTGFGMQPLPEEMPVSRKTLAQMPGFSELPEEQQEKMLRQLQLMKHPSKHCTCLRLATDMKTVIADTAVLPTQGNAAGTGFEGHAFFEASSIRKIGDTYYLVYSSQVGHELCYATSQYADRDFRYGGVIISNADLGYRGNTAAKAYYANNHGGMVQVNGQWYIFYHRHTNKTQFSRQGCAEPIQIAPDGSVAQVEMTSCGLNGGAMPASGVYPAYIICNLLSKDGATLLNPQMGEPKEAPYITEENTGTAEVREYVHNLRSGDFCAVKYLDFVHETHGRVSLRGKGRLQIRLDDTDGQLLGTVCADAPAWGEFTYALPPIIGRHAVCFRATDTEDGYLDFLQFAFD